MEMPEGPEKHVFDTIRGAFKSRETLEAERPPHVPPYDEGQVMIQNWVNLIERQGVLLAELSIVPATKLELIKRMPGLARLAPVWLEAEALGGTMTAERFMLGTAQTLIEHRKVIERVVAEQVIEPELIEKALKKAPIPREDEKDSPTFLRRVGDAVSAHTKALVEIAYDLEARSHGTIDPKSPD